MGEDFSHCHVPKTVNLAEQFAAKHGKSGPPTTIMIRNIPNRYTQQQVMMELDSLGFAESYDFFYAPMDKQTKCTVGYAFVNFFFFFFSGHALRRISVLSNARFHAH